MCLATTKRNTVHWPRHATHTSHARQAQGARAARGRGRPRGPDRTAPDRTVDATQRRASAGSRGAARWRGTRRCVPAPREREAAIAERETVDSRACCSGMRRRDVVAAGHRLGGGSPYRGGGSPYRGGGTPCGDGGRRDAVATAGGPASGGRPSVLPPPPCGALTTGAWPLRRVWPRECRLAGGVSLDRRRGTWAPRARWRSPKLGGGLPSSVEVSRARWRSPELGGGLPSSVEVDRFRGRLVAKVHEHLDRGGH